MASKKNAEDAQKEQSTRVKNAGPAGFALFEYQSNKDHSAYWIHFKRQLLNYVIRTYDPMIEEVIEHGTRPVVPKLDLAELASSTPSRFIKPVTNSSEQEVEEDVFVSEDLDKESSTSTKASTKKPAAAAVKKPQRSSVMSTDGEENPLYHVEMVVFDTELKELTNARLKKVNLNNTQLEHFYQIIWNQCGLSMQLFIKNIKA